MYKKFSRLDVVKNLRYHLKKDKLIKHYKRGRPPIVEKELSIAYIIVEKFSKTVYRSMEFEGEVYLQHKYDHGSYFYHYKNLSEDSLVKILHIYEKLCKSYCNEIYLHMVDSTAQSTSVREERLRGGTRNKTKLTGKLHTIVGYDPPNQILIVEAAIISDKHLSDSKGAVKMLNNIDIKGLFLGDSAYETYELINKTVDKNLRPIFKPQKRNIRKKYSLKNKYKKIWNGNQKRLYKAIRATVETIYGAATKAGIIHTHNRLEKNRRKDSLIIPIRQNVFNFFRLKTYIYFLDKLFS